MYSLPFLKLQDETRIHIDDVVCYGQYFKVRGIPYQTTLWKVGNNYFMRHETLEVRDINFDYLAWVLMLRQKFSSFLMSLLLEHALKELKKAQVQVTTWMEWVAYSCKVFHRIERVYRRIMGSPWDSYYVHGGSLIINYLIFSPCNYGIRPCFILLINLLGLT